MAIDLIFAIALAQTAAAAPVAAAPPCAAPEYHQLDFWVGRWDVYPTGKDKLVAHSLIEKVYGCGIRENWMPLSNRPGGSLSTYVPAEKSIGSNSGSTRRDRAPSSPVAGTARRWSSLANGAAHWCG